LCPSCAHLALERARTNRRPPRDQGATDLPARPPACLLASEGGASGIVAWTPHCLRNVRVPKIGEFAGRWPLSCRQASEQRYPQERSGSEAFHRSRPSLPAGERPVKGYPLPGKPAAGSDAGLCAPTHPHRDGSDGVRVPSRGRVWSRGAASVKFPEATRFSTWAGPRPASEPRASRRATRRAPAAIPTLRRGPRACCCAERPRVPEPRCARRARR
jgi:hypothetical protein